MSKSVLLNRKRADRFISTILPLAPLVEIIKLVYDFIFPQNRKLLGNNYRKEYFQEVSITYPH